MWEVVWGLGEFVRTLQLPFCWISTNRWYTHEISMVDYWAPTSGYSKDDELVCFSIYPLSMKTEFQTLFMKDDRAFANLLGLPLYQEKKDGNQQGMKSRKSCRRIGGTMVLEIH